MPPFFVFRPPECIGVRADAQLGCSGPTRQTLSEVWYYAHALGRTQEGIYKPIDQTTKSNCNATAGVWYYERTQGSEA